MSEAADRSLEQRVERLERLVDQLQRERRAASAGPPRDTERQRKADSAATSWPAAAAAADGEQSSAARSFDTATVRGPATGPRPPRDVGHLLPARFRSSEYWLNKIGIGLLLFGLAFLFHYSINRGWLTPEVRVACGLVAGILLTAAGLRIAVRRRHFGHVLTGGGIAAFYITGFAAFQIFGLVSYAAAFAFMVAVTLLALGLSVGRSAVVLALIGTAGGLGTPFLLYRDSGSLPGLIGYTCLVLCGSLAIHFLRGWRTVLWVSVIGGWAIHLTALIQLSFSRSSVLPNDRISLQAGIVFCWLAFWIVPLVRSLRAAPAGSGGVETGASTSPAIQAWARLSRTGHRWQVHLLCVSTPLITLMMTGEHLSLPDRRMGWISLVGAALYALVALGLARADRRGAFGFTHALVAGLLLTLGLVFLLEGEPLLFALAGELALLHALAQRLRDRRVSLSAHALSAVTGVWLLVRIFLVSTATASFSTAYALADLWAIALAAVASLWMFTRVERATYAFLAHVLLLGLVYRELSPLVEGQAWVTIVWGLYAVTLFVVALRRGMKEVRLVAMGTLLLVVGKLFIVDLSRLEPLWRVLLFVGFGGLFLLLSYFFRALWKPDQDRPEP